MRIAVVGAGAVGGYFGARLAAAGSDVTFVARGAQLDALRRDGLTVESPLGDLRLDSVRATDDASTVGPCDVVLFGVKAHHTQEAAAEHLPHLVGDGTIVVSLQNGVDNEERIAQIIGPERVVGGLALIFAGLTGPGRVVHTGGPAKLVVGELDGTASDRVQRFVRTCEEAGVAVELSRNVRGALWDKFAFICAQAGTTAAVRLPIGAIRSTPESWTLFRRLIAEVYAVARAEGVVVADDAVEERVAFAAQLPPGAYSSLHDDLVAGRPLELEGLHGTVLALARRHGAAPPPPEAVHAVLAPWAARNAAGRRG
jgi:2-dehydropantoate 2-reductase